MFDNDQQVSQDDQILFAALAYARQGYRVLPIRPGTKVPALLDWTTGATTDAETIAEWFGLGGDYRGFNVGIATGRASNLFVVDIDTGHGPEAQISLDALTAQYGDLPTTKRVTTPSGGTHLWYSWPPETPDDNGDIPTWRNAASGVLGRGIDIRAEGGQIVVWPSRLADGTQYDVPLGEQVQPPRWLADRTRFKERTSTGTVVSMTDLSAGAQDAAGRYAMSTIEGVISDLKGLAAAATPDPKDYAGDPWDSTCYRKACRLIEVANADWSPIDMASAEAIFMQSAPTDAGFTDTDHQRIWNSAARYMGDKQATLPDLQRTLGGSIFGTPLPPALGATITPQTRPQSPADLRAALFTQRGGINFDILAALVIGDDLRRGTDRGYWVYESGVWKPSEEVVEHRAIREVGGAWRAGFKSTLEAQVNYLLTDKPLIGEAMHPDLINVQNGMVRWETGTLEEHAPDHRSTIQMPVQYDPDATCPTFDRWVAAMIPEAVQARFWEVLGYMLLNGNPKQTAFLLFGSGNNGKSTLIRVLAKMIGRENTSAVTLRAMATNDYSVANLYGSQANLAGDIEARYLNDTSTFKALTGGDRVTVRRIYQKEFEFTCHATPMFSANEMWRSSDNTFGYLRRWTILPMPRDIRDVGWHDFNERDLYDEIPGIFNRALVGLRRTMLTNEAAHPFTESAETRIVTDDFEQQSDLVRTWIAEDDAVMAEPGSTDDRTWIKRDAIYNRFRIWCIQNGHEKPMASTKFYGRLDVLEYKAKGRAGGAAVGGGRGYLGFRINALESGYLRNEFPTLSDFPKMS